MTEKPEEIRKELAKRELARRYLLNFRTYTNPNFELNWHHKLLCDKLERVASGEIRRLIVTMPPRHTKSHIVSEAFPAWFMGRYPGALNPVIATSYSAELAQTFGRKVRNMMKERSYANVFPDTQLSDDSQAVDKLTTIQGNEYFAVGAGGAITGRGAKVAIVDDPIKGSEDASSELARNKLYEWFQSTLLTRLMPGGSVIICATRWHEDDLIGRLIDAGGWEILNLPAVAEEDDEYRKKGDALWPAWFPVQALEETKKAVGPYVWSALYQCTPTSEENMEFRPGWIRYADDLPPFGETFITVDTAMSKKDSADYSGFCMNRVDRNGAWHIKAWHERLNPEELVAKLFQLNDLYRPNAIGIEKTTFTVGLKPYIDRISREKQTFLPIKELSHGNTKKELRIRGLIPVYSSGSVYHVKGECDDLEAEMRTFPNGKNDDVLDSAAFQLQLVNSGSPRFQKPSFEYSDFDAIKQKATKAVLSVEVGDNDVFGFTLCLVDRDGIWHLKSWEDTLDADALVGRIFGLQSWLEDEGLTLDRLVWPDCDFTKAVVKTVKREMNGKKVFFSIRAVKPVKDDATRHALISRYKSGKIKHVSGECGTLEAQLMLYPDVRNAAALNSACQLGEVLKDGNAATGKSSPISKFLG